MTLIFSRLYITIEDVSKMYKMVHHRCDDGAQTLTDG